MFDRSNALPSGPLALMNELVMKTTSPGERCAENWTGRINLRSSCRAILYDTLIPVWFVNASRTGRNFAISDPAHGPITVIVSPALGRTAGLTTTLAASEVQLPT